MKVKSILLTAVICVVTYLTTDAQTTWSDYGSYSATDDNLYIKDNPNNTWETHRNVELEGNMLLHGEMNAICFGDVLNNYHHGWGEYSIEYVLDDNNTHTNGGLNFWKPWGNTYDNAAHNNIMFLANNSYVGIGTGSPTHKLTVNGWISCEGVKVISAVGADFVFSDNYKLLSLAEVEDFINKNKHLPEIASAE